MQYVLNCEQKVYVPKSRLHPVLGELLSNYTCGGKWNVVKGESETEITIGEFEKAEVEDAEFVLHITQSGVYIKGNDSACVMRGFVTFLDSIKYCEKRDVFYVECGTIYGRPDIAFRSVHLCVFPETKLEFLRKTVRACAVIKYTHIVFEFWGMLKFDCMKELSWPFAHEKAEIKELVAEANALGVEIIPMFNHLGHAAACREVHGKHVILDQNPKLQYMFKSYGWIWDITREDVVELQRKVREELIEVCGAGSYFHLGCDEAYAIGHDAKSAKEMADYINKVSAELKAKGRRAIMWHDMLLSKSELADSVGMSSREVSEVLCKTLDKNILIADWEYYSNGTIWESSGKLQKEGFEVLCCPWHKPQNVRDGLNTLKKYNLFGLMHTTWNTLEVFGFREMVYAGVSAYGAGDKNMDDIHRFYCAELARKVMPSGGVYEKAGWSEKSVGPGL